MNIEIKRHINILKEESKRRFTFEAICGVVGLFCGEKKQCSKVGVPKIVGEIIN